MDKINIDSKAITILEKIVSFIYYPFVREPVKQSIVDSPQKQKPQKKFNHEEHEEHEEHKGKDKNQKIILFLSAFIGVNLRP